MFLSDLRRSFAQNAARVAIEFPNHALTYRDLEQAAESVSALFQRKGIVAGERIALFLESKEVFLLAYLGSLWAGAVPLPLNPGFKPREVTYFLNDSTASLLVHDDAAAELARNIHEQCPTLRELVPTDEIRSATAPRHYRPTDPRPDDSALILYSSGTTGEPKGVVHTQANLARAVGAIAAAWRFTPDDVLVNVLPLFHIHGLSFATNVSLRSGSTMIVADSFHPIRTMDLIDRATVFMAVPPYYHSLLKRDEFRAQANRWDRLRLATCGSAPIQPEVLPHLESILGRPLINRYGMTECHVLTSLPLDGPWPHGSVGVPLEGIEVTVRTDSGRPAAPREVGRVLARGPNLFREYWRRPEATRESFSVDGWFDTGDMGQFDEHGFLMLVGRSKELIIVGGFNVYPAVVERVLAECPGVREAAVVGVPDETRGERVAAFVVSDDPTLDAPRIRSFCRERLVDYQCPTLVEIVPSLPRGPMGKILRRELRDALIHQQGTRRSGQTA